MQVKALLWMFLVLFVLGIGAEVWQVHVSHECSRSAERFANSQGNLQVYDVAYRLCVQEKGIWSA